MDDTHSFCTFYHHLSALFWCKNKIVDNNERFIVENTYISPKAPHKYLQNVGQSIEFMLTAIYILFAFKLNSKRL